MRLRKKLEKLVEELDRLYKSLNKSRTKDAGNPNPYFNGYVEGLLVERFTVASQLREILQEK